MTKPKEVVVLLHNIRSTHNVGSIFRTSDALGVSKIYISGYTPTPIDRFNRPRKGIAKVSLGAEKSIAWEYLKDPKSILKKLKQGGFEIVALEQAKGSKNYKNIKVKNKTVFVVGNEVEGISRNLLKLSDIIVEIPMKGEKESLNVSVAFAVALFRILDQ